MVAAAAAGGGDVCVCVRERERERERERDSHECEGAAPVSTCRTHRMTLGVFIILHPIVLRQVLSLFQNLTPSARLAGHGVLGTCLSLPCNEGATDI